MKQQRFQFEVIEKLTTLTTSYMSIVDHLERLNGSVARHEEKLQTISLHDAKGDEKSRINAKLVSVGVKALWSVAGAVGAFVLTHLDKISKVFLP